MGEHVYSLISGCATMIDITIITIIIITIIIIITHRHTSTIITVIRTKSPKKGQWLKRRWGVEKEGSGQGLKEGSGVSNKGSSLRKERVRWLKSIALADIFSIAVAGPCFRNVC